MRRFVLAILAAAAIAASGCAAAQEPGAPDCSLPEGAKLMVSKDAAARERGLAMIRCAAESGDVEAQTHLAFLLDAGFGVRPDPAEAVKWLALAVEKNHPPAMTRLAFAYLHARGVPLDKAKARALLLQAAELGDGEAMANLGAMYGMGDGVAQSNRQAAEWYRKAADRGSLHGQFALAILYLQGEGVDQNFGACYLYATLAAKRSYPKANELAKLCEDRLSPEQKATEDRRLLTRQPQPGP